MEDGREPVEDSVTRSGGSSPSEIEPEAPRSRASEATPLDAPPAIFHLPSSRSLSPSPPIEVRFERGVHLPAYDLWLDPHDDRPRAFVSHAHADHLGKHGEVIVSEETATLMRARSSAGKSEHRLRFREPFVWNGAELTLLPAGHIVGSAMLHLRDLATGATLLYTGDFKLRPGLSSEPAEVRPAHTLITETTFGRPIFRFPPTEQVVAQVVEWCREGLAEGAVPVLFGYSLGKGQEIICALAQAGLEPMLHGAVHKMTEVVRTLRPDFPPAERYDPARVQGKVLVCPPSAAGSRMILRLPKRRTAMLTGWALQPGAAFRYQCDEAFPLSDHADYPDLLRLVDLVKPRRVLTLHGSARQFAADLRRRGVEAWALGEENQMDLTLTEKGREEKDREDGGWKMAGGASSDVASNTREDGVSDSIRSGAGTLGRGAEFIAESLPSSIAPDTVAVSLRSALHPLGPSPSDFSRFTRVLDELAATASKLKKTAILAEWLRELPDAELEIAARGLTGRVFARSEERTLQAGGAIVWRSLLAAGRFTEEELRRFSVSHGDLASTAREALEGRTQPEPWTLGEARKFFEELEAARGPARKGELLSARFARLGAPEAGALIKLLSGDLRIGLKEGLVEDAVAAAFDPAVTTAAPIHDSPVTIHGSPSPDRDLAEPSGDSTPKFVERVREANQLTGDIGRTAVLARQGRLGEAALALFQPVRVMLASPEPDAAAMWARHLETAGGKTGDPAWLEDKFDGVRAQVHAGADGRCEIYTRDLRRVTRQFEEVAHAARAWAAANPGRSAVWDGEVLAFAEGKALTFFDLQKRLGRQSEPDLFAAAGGSGAAVPVSFSAFDLLSLDGETLLRQPLRERRTKLDAMELPANFRRVEVQSARSADEVEAAFVAARARGSEGLIAKDPASIYAPGRRGLAWLKFKKELATIDAVIIGAEWGHGKRHKLLSDYTFAVRDDATGALLSIGKAYSGLTDAEIGALTEELLGLTLETKGKYHVVEPRVVLEIAFDSIQPSARHKSGLAMRFPRIKGIRRDKTAAEADTVSAARRIAGL